MRESRFHKLTIFLIFFLFCNILPEPNSKPYTLLILGDSLTEGFGVDKEEAFPAKLEILLKDINSKIKVINGGNSGSTSASGIASLKWYAKAKPDAILIALGSNDGLRGTPLEATQKNLEDVIAFAQANHWKVFLAGMQIPPNYGEKYTQGFKKIYPRLAKKYQLPLMKFLLQDVAGESGMNLVDGIHPNATGHTKIADNVFQFIAPYISQPSKKK